MRPWRPDRGGRFTMISTSRPSMVKKHMSRSVEKPDSWPRGRREIRLIDLQHVGGAILGESPRANGFGYRDRKIAFTRRSSGLGRPMSANTLPLPSSTAILLFMACYSLLSRREKTSSWKSPSSREREDVRQPLTAAKVPGLYCRKRELLWAAWSNLTKKGAALPNSRGSLCMVRRRDSFLFTVTGFYCLDD